MSLPKQSESFLTPALPIEKVHGALLGAAVGDALGWPYEQNAGRVGKREPITGALAFQAWRRRCGGRFQPYEEAIGAGEYSDDTQLLLATVRSLLDGEHWAQYLSHHELPLWLMYERGGGGATKRAAAAWQRNIKPWSEENAKQRVRYFEAGGNGVAMRILPHILVSGQTEHQMLRDIIRNGILTHGHPRALLGARVYAQAAWHIAHTPPPLAYGGVVEAVLDSQSAWERPPEHAGGTEASAAQWLEAADKHFEGGYMSVWRATVEELHCGLLVCRRAIKEGALSNDQAVLQELGCFERKTNGSGITAALATLYLFAAHAADPLVGLRTVAFAPSADTDTLASMLGGLFGLSCGLEWLPAVLKQVQDYTLIADVAAQLVQPRARSIELPKGHWSQRDEQDIMKRLAAMNEGEFTLGVLDKATIISKRFLKALTKNLVVNEWQLHTLRGQTLYIKHLHKIDQKQATPAARSDSSPTLAAESGIPRHVAVNLLNDFARTIPAGFSGQTALRVVAKVVATPQPTEDTVDAILRDLAPELSLGEQRALIRVCVKNLVSEAEGAEPSPS